jgi:P-type Ca2+ transporter type 2B
LDHKNSLTEDIILETIPFSSERKRASIVVHNLYAKGTNSEVRVYTKGGPDMLLNYTSHIINKEGIVE